MRRPDRPTGVPHLQLLHASQQQKRPRGKSLVSSEGAGRRRGVKAEVGRDGGSVCRVAGKLVGGCRGRSTCGKCCGVVLINTPCAAAAETAAAVVLLSQPAAEAGQKTESTHTTFIQETHLLN